ncbi:Cullin [Fennellomyces sp. T-0311]|nr:Cullin [Fennellomyces sp. T-0311]
MLFDFTLRKQRHEEDMDIDLWNVKNLKEHTEHVTTDMYFDMSWEDHRSVIMSILRGENRHVINVQTAYELSTNICQSGKADKLYTRLHRELTLHFTEVANLLESMATSNDDFLGYLNTMWTEKKDHIAQIGQIFCELERSYVLRQTHYRTIADIGIDLFKTHVLQKPLVKERLLQNLLFLIRSDRKGRMVDTELIGSLVQLLIDAGMYNSEFEPRLLENMADYYEHEAQRLINKLSVPDFLLYTSYQSNREESQQTYLLSSTRKKLIKVVTDKFARSNMSILVSNGLYTMIDTNDLKALKMIYTACGPNNLSILRQSIMSYIKERGATLFERHQDATKPQSHTKFLKLLIKFKAKLERAVRDGLENDVMLARGVGDAFGDLFRDHEQQVARMVVKFIDATMRQMKSDVEASSHCEQALAMFRYLQEKDAFESMYKVTLAKRLLFCASRIEHENIVVDGLKSACGEEYAKEIQAMIKDVTESETLTSEFLSTQQLHSDIKLNIMTLDKTRWSSHVTSEKISIPPELNPILASYETAYKGKHKNHNRRLEWAHSLGTCTLEASFPCGSKTLVTSFPQARILLEFNNAVRVSWKLSELSSTLSIGKPELDVALELLCHPDHPILVTLENSSDPAYRYNEMFRSNKNVIVVNRSADQDEQQSRLVNQVAKIKLDDNRKHQTEAAVVRVMKKKRKLKHSDLIAELRPLLPFSIETRGLKQVVESLIQKGFLERAGRHSWVYAYVQE